MFFFKQQAKQLKKGANEHKLKIIFNITLQGVRVINEKTQVQFNILLLTVYVQTVRYNYNRMT